MRTALIRFAILHDDAALEEWQARCLERLAALPDVQVCLLITLRKPAPELPRRLAGIPHVLMPRSSNDSDKGSSERDAVAQLTSRAADFLLSFIDGPCPPIFVSVPRYGVWQFQFGDWTRYRGGPVGFWEVYDGESVSAALLTRALPSCESVMVLRSGYFRTNLLSYTRNRAKLLGCVSSWPAQLCVDIRNDVTSRFSSSEVHGAAKVRGMPTRRQLITCWCRIAVRVSGLIWRSLFRHDQWNVGIVEQPIAAFLRPQNQAVVKWLPSPNRSEMRADPFGILRDGRLTILCEHLNYHENRGYIVAIDPTTAPRSVRVAIGPVPAVHMSYPYLVRGDERMLCIPETSEPQEIALYESERFPDRWIKIANFVTGTAIVDASLFRHGKFWWIAGSEVAPKGANCELHLWYSQSIVGPWHPHPGNPVKIDVRSARPAGTPFIEDGVLYRPAQDCSRTYGGRVIINRVHTLTPVAFHEEAVVAVNPDSAGPYPSGLHTLSQVGTITLIDGKRMRFIPAEFRRTLFANVKTVLNRCHVRPHSSPRSPND